METEATVSHRPVTGGEMFGSPHSRASLILLLGRRDSPVDGVEDYCTFLAEALREQNVTVHLVRVDWLREGWLRSLRRLWRDASKWQGSWVAIQYTSLAWSRRGFPVMLLAVLEILRREKIQCAISFHEPAGTPAARPFDRIRSACQTWVVRQLHARATLSIFADPADRISWLKQGDAKAEFIPIGANIPERVQKGAARTGFDRPERTVAVFCLSNPPNADREIQDIAVATRRAAENGLRIRVVFVGRGTAEATKDIAVAFRGSPVEIANLGLREPTEISEILAESDALLCVRGCLYPRRGSAIAGIACGLPIIGYAGQAEGTPLAEAGVVLVPYGDRNALGAALSEVLGNSDYSRQLRSKSVQAQRKYFSWPNIAVAFIGALKVRAS